MAAPTVRVIVQPAKVLRFRYEREGRAGGLIVGASTTPQNKTYPKIQIEGYRGRALVITSCVTKDEPYRPHPHKLVGKGCRKGVCTMEVSLETMSVEFISLGIQCMRRRDIEDSLKMRKDINVDPFKTGFARYNHSNSHDLTAVRLCFQVVLQDKHGEFSVPLTPVVSEPIYDKRVVSDLTIVKLSKCVCPVDGGKEEIILVCDKVVKNDIQIRFYEEQDGQLVWEEFGVFAPADVYRQVVIWFRPPCYKTLNVTSPVKVFLQLQRPSDGETSEPVPFEFRPLEPEAGMLNRMRQKSRNLFRNFSIPPLPKEEQYVNMLYPEHGQLYGNVNPIDLPNPIIPFQSQYSLPTSTMVTPPLISSLQSSHFQFPNMEETPSTSGTAQNPNGGRTCDLNFVHTPNLPSSSEQEYPTSVHLLNSLSPPTNPDERFPFSNMEHALCTQNDVTENAVMVEPQNNLDANNSSDMDIQLFADLSRLLIAGNDQQPELKLINIDSGELDTMNISS